MREFLLLDEEAQSTRTKTKDELNAYKQELAKREAEAAAERKQQAGKSSKMSKANKSSKSGKTKKSSKTAKDSKSSKTSKVNVFGVECDLKVGLNVLGFWPNDDGTGKGEWFEGVVQSVDYVDRTVDILYNDGDRDDSVPWNKTRILDDIELSDG